MFFTNILNKHKTSILNFIIFFSVSFICYNNVLNVGLFSDDFFWIDRYNKWGFSGFKFNFNDDFFLPISHFFQIVILKIFGINNIFFHFTNIFLLSTIGYFLRIAISYFGKLFNVENLNHIPLLISLLFITSPYNTEVMNWYTAQSYLISTLFFVISFNFYLKFKLYSKFNYLTYSLIAFFVSIFSKEISLVLFPIVFVIELFTANFKSLLKNSLYFFIVVLIYFIVRAIFFNDIIGGYGFNIHTNYSLGLVFNNILAYISKFFGYHRYLNNAIDYYKLIFIISYSLLMISVLIFYFSRKTLLKPLILLFCLFILSLIPVINLETSFLENLQSDRYGFLPSIFAYTTIVFLISSIVKKIKFTIAIVSILIGLNITLTIITNKNWIIAEKIKNEFYSQIIKRVNHNECNIFLNLPDNYRGVYIFRNGFKDFLKLKNIYFKNVDFISLQNIVNEDFNLVVDMKQDSIIIKSDRQNYFMTFMKNHNLKVLNPSIFYLIKKVDCNYWYYSKKQLNKIN